MLNKTSLIAAIGMVMAPGTCKVPMTELTALEKAGLPAIAVVRSPRLELLASAVIRDVRKVEFPATVSSVVRKAELLVRD